MKKEMIFLILAGILYGTVISGGQLLSNSGLSSFEISFTTMFVQCVIFFILMKVMKKKIDKKDLELYAIIGLVNAVSQIVWTGAVVLGIPVAIVTLLLYTQPVWTLILSKFFFGEKITPIKIAVLVTVLTGIIFLVSPWSSKGSFNTFGLFFAFLSGPLFSIYLLLSKNIAERKIHYASYVFGHVLFTLLWLLLILPIYQLLIHNNHLSRFDILFLIKNAGIILIVSLIIRVLPITLLYKSLSKIKASTVGIVLLLEPVSGTILAFVLFQQPITVSIIFGGLLIIGANYLIIKNESLVKKY